MSNLPFLNKKRITTVLMGKMKPDHSVEVAPAEEEGEVSSLHSVAEDLIAAVHGKDAAKVAEALEAAIEICGSYDEAPESLES